MCGIVGYVGTRKSCLPVLLSGLKALEYRGYDSAGVALINDQSELTLFKKVGPLANLLAILPSQEIMGSIGIGHTRWATHGIVTDENAHPHVSGKKRFIAIHNGIFEGHEKIKAKLAASGYPVSGNTDTEVFICFVEYLYDQQLAKDPALDHDQLFLFAVKQALNTMKGAYAVVVLSLESRTIIAARNISPLVVGLGEEENFVASDPSALLEYTDKFVFLTNETVAIITKEKVSFMELSGTPIELPIKKITKEEEFSRYNEQSFPHIMMREIAEQPDVLQRIISDSLDVDGRFSYQPGMDVSDINRIQLIACGTAHNAALYGKYALEKLARIPAMVETASEFRYRDPVLDSKTLVIVVSQSGETIDTLEALRHAKSKGARSIGIINVPNSAMAREVDSVFKLRAGKEVGVASTKAFTGMLLALAIFSIYLGKSRGQLTAETVAELVVQMRKLPDFCQKAVEETMRAASKLAKKYSSARSIYFFGRGMQYPIALEGALKLKEISYIHAEAYPAGELKHGPIALIDSAMPTVAIATDDALYEKVAANIYEIVARQGPVVAVVSESRQELRELVSDVIVVPNLHELFAPIISAIPMQLIAYEVAVVLGRNVDKPRNLAKSVTVE